MPQNDYGCTYTRTCIQQPPLKHIYVTCTTHMFVPTVFANTPTRNRNNCIRAMRFDIYLSGIIIIIYTLMILLSLPCRRLCRTNIGFLAGHWGWVHHPFSLLLRQNAHCLCLLIKYQWFFFFFCPKCTHGECAVTDH